MPCVMGIVDSVIVAVKRFDLGFHDSRSAHAPTSKGG